jgi:arylsulfatase A-like enzyme
LLKQTGKIKKRALYWHFPQYTTAGTKTGPYSCMIKDDWKFYLFYEDNGVQLFNLKEDPYELNDLSEVKPEKVIELRKDLIAWKKAVNANDCIVNPDFDGKKIRGKEFSYKQALTVRNRREQLKRTAMK